MIRNRYQEPPCIATPQGTRGPKKGSVPGKWVNMIPQLKKGMTIYPETVNEAKSLQRVCLEYGFTATVRNRKGEPVQVIL